LPQWELLLPPLDAGSGASTRARLARALREAVRTGRLAPGKALPPTRTLARDLALSRGVVVDAYEQLVAEGYLVARMGSGTVVAPAAAAAPAADHAAPDQGRVLYDFRPGRPDIGQFPRDQWLRAMRRALQALPNASLGYGGAAGTAALRAALAAYLSRVRGVRAVPHQVLVSTGLAQGLALLLRVLAARGHRRLAVEDPGPPELRELAAHAGLEAVPVPVDEAGVRIAELEGCGARAVLVTPALRLGWVVAPDALWEAVARAKHFDDLGSGALEQLALADLIERGDLDRHLRRMRPRYRRRRDRLVAALAPLAPRVHVSGVAAGLHAVLELPSYVDEEPLLRRAAERSLALYGLGRCRAGALPGPPGLVLGYAGCPEHAFEEGLRALVEVLEGALAPAAARRGAVRGGPAARAGAGPSHPAGPGA
jgi:GntR family transcriptional regulator/MocR family aminotransferase